MKARYELLIIIVLAFAVIGTMEIVGAETFQQSIATDFSKTCTNTTGSICQSTANCELTIKYPKSNSFAVNNVSMTNNNNGIFNYTLNSANLSVLGEYNWDMFCCEGTNCGEAHGTFDTTSTGVELSQEKAIIYLGMLALLVFILIALLVALPFIPRGNNKDEDYFVGINSLKYLRPVIYAISWGVILAILFTSSNISYLYLESQMMGNLLFAFYSICMWLTLPATFVWFIFIIANLFRDKEMKQMIERGVKIPSTP